MFSLCVYAYLNKLHLSKSGVFLTLLEGVIQLNSILSG